MTIRFTIRDLLLSMALISAGFAGFRYFFQTGGRDIMPLEADGMILVWFASGASICAGISGPLTGRWGMGAYVGFAIQVVLLLGLG